MDYKYLPYSCKELINLYCLNKYTDYEPLKEFNKICDYEPCKYSSIKLKKADKLYKQKIVHNKEQIKRLTESVLTNKENVNTKIMNICISDYNTSIKNFNEYIIQSGYLWCINCNKIKYRHRLNNKGDLCIECSPANVIWKVLFNKN